MFKALIKKQFLQMFSTFSFEGKKAGKRKPWMPLLIGALIVYAVGAEAYLFWDLSKSMCEPLVMAGLGWVYFALLTTMGFSMSSVLVMFMMKSQVYEAKDNELLFSMPIPSWMILITRMIGQYLLALLLIVCMFAFIGRPVYRVREEYPEPPADYVVTDSGLNTDDVILEIIQ